jgi:UDP-2,4-diacetamido-2,4,6-trideoxy-beta-L-altropyranose hydrolase
MDLIIRADASPEIGTGHVMRCLALAQAWRPHGGKVTFVGESGGEALRQRIAAEGFAHTGVDRPHPHPSDLAKTLALLNDADHPWLVLDGYRFDSRFHGSIRKAGHRLVVIDDMNHLPAYHADVLVNQNLHAPSLSYRYDADTVKLLGTRFALLRREFLRYRVPEIAAPEKAAKILVTMGGADPENVTGKVVAALSGVPDPELKVKVVVGPANRHRRELEEGLSALPFSLDLLTGTFRMPELMHWAHMAVSAAGSTCWELAHAGVPALFISLADNQRPLAEALQDAGAAVDLGWHSTLGTGELRARFTDLMGNPQTRRAMAQTARSLVDGNGAARVAARLRGSPFYLRRAGIDDAPLLFRWANMPEVRRSAFSVQPIAWESHLIWFREKLSSEDSALYIAVDNGERPIGQIRFDRTDPETAEIDVSVAVEATGRGFGTALLKEATAVFLSDEPGVNVLCGRIKPDNTASIRVFEKAGYRRGPEENRDGRNAVCFTRSRNEREGS